MCRLEVASYSFGKNPRRNKINGPMSNAGSAYTWLPLLRSAT